MNLVKNRLKPELQQPRPRVLFLNRSYWPDAEATGQLLAELCEDLAVEYDVTVLAGQPNHNPHEATFRRMGIEDHRGVRICRVWHTRFSKRLFFGRAINLLSYLVMAMLTAFCLPRVDMVVTETDPFLLPILGNWLRKWRGCKHVVYLQDIYPDVAVNLGVIREGWVAQGLRWLLHGAYRRAERVIVLSRDMRDLLIASGISGDQICCIPNWTDTDRIVPLKQNNNFRAQQRLDGRFVVMYSGNMGLSQRLDHVLCAAARLQERKDIEFVFVGDGAARHQLEAAAARQSLHNVRFLPYQPKEELASSLSAADLHVVTVDPRLRQCMMPSKLYGILASGTAVLTIAAMDSELCEVVERAGVGLAVRPDDTEALTSAICWGAAHRDELAAMGQRARQLAEREYDRSLCTGRFGAILAEVMPATVYTPPLPVGNAQVAEPLELHLQGLNEQAEARTPA